MNIMKDLSLTNYAAVSILEHLDMELSQKRINIIEALVLMATYPLEVEADTIEQCVGGDKLAYHFLVIKNKELRQRIIEIYFNR